MSLDKGDIDDVLDNTLDDIEKCSGEMVDLILKKASNYNPKTIRSRSFERSRKRRHSSISSSSASSKSRSITSDDSPDRRHKKALQRKIRHKEEDYQRELCYWQDRERRKAKEYAKEEKSKDDKRIKKLRKFLANYDDEKDDPKYYSKSLMKEKRKTYEKERSRDTEDIWLERQEQNQLEMKVNQADEKVLKNADVVLPPPAKSEMPIAEEESTKKGDVTWENVADSVVTNEPSIPPPPPPNFEFNQAPIKVSFKPQTQLSTVFGEMEDEVVDTLHVAKKKIKPFEITSEDRAQVLTSEERRKLTKDLITRIPHEKAEIFSYPIPWEQVDKKLADERILPWVKRKVAEFLGEEDMDVTNYVVENVLAHVDPNKLLEELTEIVDKEAEGFVIKLWKLVIYESESKKLGISTPAPRSYAVKKSTSRSSFPK